MNSESYNADCNGEMRWDEDGDGLVMRMMVMIISMMPVMMVMMMLMMISMIPVTMVMTMVTISPSRRCSPRRNLPTEEVFSSM